MDKIWVVRGMDDDRFHYTVDFFRSEDAAFKRKEQCEKEAEEDGFGDTFVVTGPHVVK